MKKILILVVSTCFLFACESDDTEKKQLKEDIKKIEAYLEENNIDAQSTDSGLFYTIEKQGAGDSPKNTSWVKVRYEGMLLDEQVFDEGIIESYLTDFIDGWIEGMKYFKEGGSGTLFIPSKLGYGDQANGSIPANSILIFHIDLLEVTSK